MQFNTLNVLILTLAGAISSTDALGINCRGSSKCSALFGSSSVARDLTNVINNIDENRWYRNGEHIACVGNQAGNGGGYCAFLQNTGGAPGRNIKGLAHFITDHGCKMCGSVPYFYPADNNVDNGQLTYNFVDSKSRPFSRSCSVKWEHVVVVVILAGMGYNSCMRGNVTSWA
ncbi:unnamed protein product [Fusarium venenatum]|uniref:Killer toxin Kp4 domain-containing protein n=1 Tax=Fusarium venenatum TaxID=56646 RepID=A0A2L2SSL0_9HYPO|nr:uncharacterized protein FVRRES_04580 [Fusarium venenatum]CEI60144.1 unnamed protein product [Fusarium venenatum]